MSNSKFGCCNQSLIQFLHPLMCMSLHVKLEASEIRHSDHQLSQEPEYQCTLLETLNQLMTERGFLYLITFSIEMSQKECCDTKKAWCNFLILNDSKCQFYYKANTFVRPYKKSGRGVTCIYYTGNLIMHTTAHNMFTMKGDIKQTILNRSC